MAKITLGQQGLQQVPFTGDEDNPIPTKEEGCTSQPHHVVNNFMNSMAAQDTIVDQKHPEHAAACSSPACTTRGTGTYRSICASENPRRRQYSGHEAQCEDGGVSRVEVEMEQIEPARGNKIVMKNTKAKAHERMAHGMS